MLTQKEFDLMSEDLKNKKISEEDYEKWFVSHVNCEAKDNNRWRNGIRLCSTSNKHAVIAVQGLHGLAFRVSFDDFRMK